MLPGIRRIDRLSRLRGASLLSTQSSTVHQTLHTGCNCGYCAFKRTWIKMEKQKDVNVQATMAQFNAQQAGQKYKDQEKEREERMERMERIDARAKALSDNLDSLEEHDIKTLSERLDRVEQRISQMERVQKKTEDKIITRSWFR